MFGFELLVRVLSISCLSAMRIVTVKAPARLNSDGHSNFIHGSLMFGFCFWLEDVYDALHKEISNFFSFFLLRSVIENKEMNTGQKYLVHLVSLSFFVVLPLYTFFHVFFLPLPFSFF